MPASTDTAAGPASSPLLTSLAIGMRKGRRKALDRRESLLKRKEPIQLALFEGRLDEDSFKRIAAELGRQNAGIDDPKLSQLLAGIKLRATVKSKK